MLIRFVGLTAIAGLDLLGKESENPRFISHHDGTFGIKLSQIDPDKARSYNLDESDSTSVKVEVHITYDVSSAAFNFIENVFQGKYAHYGPNPPTLPIGDARGERVDAQGNVAARAQIPFLNYPQEIQEVVTKARAEMQRRLRCFLSLICWSQRLEPAQNLSPRVLLFWAISDKCLPVSDRRSLTVYSRRTRIRWDNAVNDQLTKLWEADAREPIARELLREAIALSSSSPRSSVLMAVAALEAGAKSHILALNPAAEVDNTQVMKLLKSTIIGMHNKTGIPDFWPHFKSALKLCGKLTLLRNKLAHWGEYPDQTEFHIRVYLEAVSDILYALDVLTGYDWAKALVSRRIKQPLKWPGWEREGGFLPEFTVSD